MLLLRLADSPRHFLLGLCCGLFFLCWLGSRLALSWLLALLQLLLLLGVFLCQLFRLLLVLLL